MNNFDIVSRCEMCGRYVKRGIFNVANHTDKCPERKVILWDGKSSKLVKQKSLKL